MSRRVFTAALWLLLLIVILFIGSKWPVVLNFALSYMCIFCVNEACSALRANKRSLWFICSLLFSAAIPMIPVSVWPMTIFTYFILIFVSIIRNYNKAFNNILSCCVLTISITASFACLSLLYAKNTIFYFLMPLFLAWVSDTAAYFVGVTRGKTKLCPNLSPNKTVEGFLGGLVVSMFCLFLYCMFFKYFVFESILNINILKFIFMAVTGYLLSVLGDLSFSAVKRISGLKDFGKAMPGHGGFMDRFDSVIFVSPFIYIFISTFKVFS